MVVGISIGREVTSDALGDGMGLIVRLPELSVEISIPDAPESIIAKISRAPAMYLNPAGRKNRFCMNVPVLSVYIIEVIVLKFLDSLRGG
jgi:hypothetical protein